MPSWRSFFRPLCKMSHSHGFLIHKSNLYTFCTLGIYIWLLGVWIPLEKEIKWYKLVVKTFMPKQLVPIYLKLYMCTSSGGPPPAPATVVNSPPLLLQSVYQLVDTVVRNVQLHFVWCMLVVTTVCNILIFSQFLSSKMILLL